MKVSDDEKNVNFDTEAYKLFISDIYSASKSQLSESYRLKLAASDVVPSIDFENSISIELRLVWLQGKITNLSKFDNSLRLNLNDGSGNIKVICSSDLDSIDSIALSGNSVAVLGQIVSNAKNGGVIKAIKVMYVPLNSYLEKLWKLEVIDLKAYLLGFYEKFT